MVTIWIGDTFWHVECSLERVRELQKEYYQKKQTMLTDGDLLDYIKFNGKEPDAFEFAVWMKVVHQIDTYYLHSENDTYHLPWKDVEINA